MIEVSITHRKYSTKLALRSKYNLLIGDSGSGKTLLSKMVSMLSGSKGFVEADGYRVFSEVGKLPSVFGRLIQEEHGSIFIIDESSVFISTNDGAELLLDSPNYFIISGRDNFNRLPYGIKSIFELQGTPRNSKMVPVATEQATKRFSIEVGTRDTVLVEGSGLDFRLLTQKLAGVDGVVSSHGKDKLPAMVRAKAAIRPVVIVDWCGTAGASMFLFDHIRSGKIRTVFSPSFEYELLGYFGQVDTLSVYDAHRYKSEELFYTECVSDMLRSQIGISYSKGADGHTAELLSTGGTVVNGVRHTLLLIEELDWLYPELTVRSLRANCVPKIVLG